MCRYGFHTYKDHFACFTCRKTFKHYLYGESVYGRGFWGPPRIDRIPLCPGCRKPMEDVGLDFRAPRRSDLRQWRKVQLLFEGAGPFSGCGCGSYPRPERLQDVPAFLAGCREKSPGSKLLQRITTSPTPRGKRS